MIAVVSNPIIRAKPATGGGGSQTPVLFQVDWADYLGGDLADLLGGKWDAYLGLEANCDVIATPASQSWPATMAKVLRIRHFDEDSPGVFNAFCELQVNGLGTIAVDETRTFRWYEASYQPNLAGGSTDQSHHGVQDGSPSGGGTNQNWNMTEVTGSTNGARDAQLLDNYEPSFRIGSGGGTQRWGLDSGVSPGLIPKSTAHRFVWQMKRLTGGLHARAWLYNADGSLRADWTDFIAQLGAQSNDPMSDDVEYAFNVVANTDQQNMGCNGSTGFEGMAYKNYGGFAISSNLIGGPEWGTPLDVYGTAAGELT